MHPANVSDLVCPASGERLVLEAGRRRGAQVSGGLLVAPKAGTQYPVVNGIPDLVFPARLQSADLAFNKKYEEVAKQYDAGMRWLFASFYETENNVRTNLADLLAPEKSACVLNMGCGTGGDSKYLLEKLGPRGRLFNLDLSAGLLRLARRKLGRPSKRLEYVRANGSRLPFADGFFDAVFHFGGINVFSQKKKAIEEMARVVRPGGRVVFGDESAAPWLAGKLYGRIIRQANPLYNHKPPLALLPGTARDVSLHYLLGNAFYAIAFTKGSPPRLNLDLPIPGKRGGTLRSRYESATGAKLE
jgi:ubiquinone/menaquinone biosynthesis C-methylase UbiE